MSSRFTVIGLAVFSLFSCSQSMDYSSDDLSSGWTYADVLQFNIEDKPIIEELEIMVNHDMGYGYENLYLKLDLTDENQTISDTISIQLADSKGLWMSSCSGTECQLKYSYAHAGKNIKSISIAQFSREETLSGINKIGINLK